ncbi:uncharacterized protein SPPG_08638 [Spizellomyces punctatus DAOM BR117]|uniref:Bromo domain-containing protein n=1 Tax=Spizellomyces punctatus (strain DAOM BR117) TaxID=645134 RepID=A0A0L0H5Q2_SPIPD|nr:uncharacterized protein SPPG_08638 [Spizellomyces punctatus DAOM BR117]KNC96043.1 hypothetical protein SPPG_08638 [Spizellomyces punctatus DAOM BR117]|eukprot:XP_016604083.1 hypothetical protein SPPG_08638 [Spizellomyces punctatus DAOM BR117]
MHDVTFLKRTPRSVPKTEVWVDIVSTRSTPGPFTPARTSARTRAHTTVHTSRTRLFGSHARGKRKLLGAGNCSEPETPAFTSEALRLFKIAQKKVSSNVKEQFDVDAYSPRNARTPRKPAQVIHEPLFVPPSSLDHNKLPVSSSPDAIQFILFCYTFADFLGWRKLDIHLLEEELVKGDSLYIIEIIIKLLRKVGHSTDNIMLSNWEETLRFHTSVRRQSDLWPRDVTFALLDVPARLRLLRELCDWVLEKQKKHLGMRPHRMRFLPVAVDDVAMQQRRYVYWHFGIGALNQRLYCQVLSWRQIGEASSPPEEGENESLDVLELSNPGVLHVVASTPESWAMFLKKVKGSRVPAHKLLRAQFTSLARRKAAVEASSEVTNKDEEHISVDGLAAELLHDQEIMVEKKRKAEEGEEERIRRLERLRAAREAARQPTPEKKASTEASHNVERRRTRLAKSAKEAAPAQPIVSKTTACDEQLRIRKTLARKQYELFTDVDKHTKSEEYRSMIAEGTHIPLWHILTNILCDLSIWDVSLKPRLWVRNLYGLQYDPDLEKREMDFIVKNACKHLVDGLKRHPSHEPFFEPIDPAQVPGYDEVIRYPMDLKTVYVKVMVDEYRAFSEFVADILTIFRNCRIFNESTSPIVYECLQLELRYVELCCCLGMVIGHSGEGLDWDDPFLLFERNRQAKTPFPKGKRPRKPKNVKTDASYTSSHDAEAPAPAKRGRKKKKLDVPKAPNGFAIDPLFGMGIEMPHFDIGDNFLLLNQGILGSAPGLGSYENMLPNAPPGIHETVSTMSGVSPSFAAVTAFEGYELTSSVEPTAIPVWTDVPSEIGPACSATQIPIYPNFGAMLEDTGATTQEFEVHDTPFAFGDVYQVNEALGLNMTYVNAISDKESDKEPCLEENITSSMRIQEILSTFDNDVQVPNADGLAMRPGSPMPEKIVDKEPGVDESATTSSNSIQEIPSTYGEDIGDSTALGLTIGQENAIPEKKEAYNPPVMDDSAQSGIQEMASTIMEDVHISEGLGLTVAQGSAIAEKEIDQELVMDESTKSGTSIQEMPSTIVDDVHDVQASETLGLISCAVTENESDQELVMDESTKSGTSIPEMPSTIVDDVHAPEALDPTMAQGSAMPENETNQEPDQDEDGEEANSGTRMDIPLEMSSISDEVRHPDGLQGNASNDGKSSWTATCSSVMDVASLVLVETAEVDDQVGVGRRRSLENAGLRVDR